MVERVIQANQRKKRGRRTTADSVVEIRYSGDYATDTGDTTPENIQEESPKKRKLSIKDILALLDEQKVFREELEEVHRTNFNLENLLSNCALKVEDFNRKLLLVEYELTDFKDTMKWEKREHEADKCVALTPCAGCTCVEACKCEDLPRNIPLRRSNRNLEPFKLGDIPQFDDGRHKLEKYAKIHGIVDVEIELYTSEEEEEEEEEEESQASLPDSSENTFSFSYKAPDTAHAVSDSSQYVDNKKVVLADESCHDNPAVVMTTGSWEEGVEPADNVSDTSLDKLPIVNTPDFIDDLEYSLVDADDDIFSNSINTTDTIEQIEIVLNTDRKAFNILAKSGDAGAMRDCDTEFSEMKRSDAGASRVRECDAGASRVRECDAGDSRVRECDAGASRVLECDAGDSKEKSFDSNMQHCDTGDSRRGSNSTADSANSKMRSCGTGNSNSTADTSTLVEAASYLVDAGVGEHSYVGCEDAGTETSGFGLMGSWVTDIFKQYEMIGMRIKPFEAKITAGEGDKERQLTAAVEDTCDLVDCEERALKEKEEREKEEREEEEREEKEMAEEEKEEKEKEEKERQRQESEAIDRLLAELEIEEDDVVLSYHLPVIIIETGVEEGAPKLREHKNDVSEDRTPTNSALEGAISELDAVELSEDDSVCDFEDSDDERRKRKKEKMKGRPFPRRAARGFFARLCACWHN